MREWLVWAAGIALVVGSIFLFGPAQVEKSPYSETVSLLNLTANGPDESIVLLNGGKEDLDLTGWRLFVEPRFELLFPQGCTLRAGKRLVIHSGPEAGKYPPTCEGGQDLQWRLDHVWCDQNGNTAYLYDVEGRLADEFRWGGGWHLSPFVPCNRDGSQEPVTLEDIRRKHD